MHATLRTSVFLGLLMIGTNGCDQDGPVLPDASPQESTPERQPLLDALARAEQESQSTKPPGPNIVLATPPGWSRTETRALAEMDNGFTVAYEHESGLAVTLYQFTRDYTEISNDLNSPLLQEEMQRAKTGIEQAVQLGYLQAAKEKKFKTVQLGASEQQALWSQYILTMNDQSLASDIYIWAWNNTLFKIRSTSRSEDVESNQAVLEPLLTAFGSRTINPE